MHLFVDIDHVLLPWDDSTSNPYKGFADWKRVPERYFSRISLDQLYLIDELFSSIYWHTTWSIHDDMANKSFCPHTGFATRENLHDIVDKVSLKGHPEEAVYHLRRAGWWKLDDVFLWLSEGNRGRVVWADDQLADFKGPVESILDHFGVRKDFLLVAPRDVWPREHIEAAADWLASDLPGRFVHC